MNIPACQVLLLRFCCGSAVVAARFSPVQPLWSNRVTAGWSQRVLITWCSLCVCLVWVQICSLVSRWLILSCSALIQMPTTGCGQLFDYWSVTDGFRSSLCRTWWSPEPPLVPECVHRASGSILFQVYIIDHVYQLSITWRTLQVVHAALSRTRTVNHGQHLNPDASSWSPLS